MLLFWRAIWPYLVKANELIPVTQWELLLGNYSKDILKNVIKMSRKRLLSDATSVAWAIGGDVGDH